MPVRAFGDGDLRVVFPSTVDVRDATRTGARRSPTTGVITELLHDSGFELIEHLAIQAPRDAAVTVDLEVTLRGDEAAVVLTEQGGYWSWRMPRERASDVGTATATFELELRPRPDDGVNAFVLRFGAPVITDAAIKMLEAGVREGLVHIPSTDPQTWAAVTSLSDVRLPEGGSPRILFLVHGVFSSTISGFGALTTDVGKDFLEQALASYDAVIGFDHRTLSVDPLANARDLLERLRVPQAEGAVVDVICHCRGGLVLRSLVERLLPGAPWSGLINRVIFVGVPNGGTSFAEPDHWSTLADVYTSLLLASTAVGDGFLTHAAAEGAVKGVGTLAKYLAAYGIDGYGVPGLTALQPDGGFIDDLNRRQPGQPDAGQPWFVITSDFRASDEQPTLKVIEGVVDDFLDDANDLVVDTKSMAAVETPAGTHVGRTFDFGINSVVHHTNYFGQVDVVEAMRAWLFPAAAAEAAMDFDADVAVELPMEGVFGLDVDNGVAFRVDGGGGGAPPPPPPGPPAALVQAHVLAEMPREPVVDEPTDVRVMLSRSKIKASAGKVSDGGAFEVDENEVLIVQIFPKRNAIVVGADEKKFRLPLDDGLSEVGFVVKPCDPGPVVVRVIVRRSATDIVASMTLKATARELADAVHRQRRVRQQVEAAASASVDLKDAVWLEISELERRGHIQFQYDLRMPGEDETQRYLSDPIHNRARLAAQLFAGIEENWKQNAGRPKDFMRYLQDEGSHLFEELFPVALQEKLWKHRNQLNSILLLADEPYFPWELVHLKPPGGPRQQPPRFLGQYGLLRWQFVPFPVKPELRRRRGHVYSVCPDYPDPELHLAENQAEAAYLKRKLRAAAVPASTEEVCEVLRNREVDILHFSGHGVASTRSVGAAKIVLRGRDAGRRWAREYLSATAVAETARLAGEGGAGPLVVLNACQVGISGQELSSLGGFARAFLERGAQAFVSCLWSVQGRPSRIFVETLYDRLIDGDSIGEAAVRARAAARTPDDPATWLGFVIYARPDAKFVRA